MQTPMAVKIIKEGDMLQGGLKVEHIGILPCLLGQENGGIQVKVVLKGEIRFRNFLDAPAHDVVERLRKVDS